MAAHLQQKFGWEAWIEMKGQDWDFNVDEGYDGQGTLGYMPRSMLANRKQGIGGPKVNGPSEPSAAATDTGLRAKYSHMEYTALNRSSETRLTYYWACLLDLGPVSLGA